MVGATGLEPATPCTPFGKGHVLQTDDFANLFVFQLLIIFINSTRFPEKGKIGEIGGTKAPQLMNDDSWVNGDSWHPAAIVDHRSRSRKQKGRDPSTPPSRMIYGMARYFLSRFLPIPARPTNPLPNSRSVEGSGTASIATVSIPRSPGAGASGSAKNAPS